MMQQKEKREKLKLVSTERLKLFSEQFIEERQPFNCCRMEIDEFLNYIYDQIGD